MTNGSPKQKLFTAFAMLQAVAALLLVASFYIRNWPFELLVSFTRVAVILLIGSLVFSTFLLLDFKKLRAGRAQLVVLGIGWVLGLYALVFSLTIVSPIEVTTKTGPAINFATFNKYYDNTDLDSLTKYFKEQDIDVLALQETQPEEVRRITEELGFEHSYSSRRLKTAIGTVTAIISKHPVESAETVNLDTNHPVIRAVINTPENGDVIFYAVHIPVPITQEYYEKRDRVMESLAKRLQEETLPVIVGGDFNTTSFSRSLRSFNEEVGSTHRPVITERWPDCSWYGFGPALCVRIDHIYVPKSATLTDFTISPPLGSDHRAVIGKIHLES